MVTHVKPYQGAYIFNYAQLFGSTTGQTVKVLG